MKISVHETARAGRRRTAPREGSARIAGLGLRNPLPSASAARAERSVLTADQLQIARANRWPIYTRPRTGAGHSFSEGAARAVSFDSAKLKSLVAPQRLTQVRRLEVHIQRAWVS